jgi:hypothetical protein
MPSDYIEKNALVSLDTGTEQVRIDHARCYDKSVKQAKDAYENKLAERELAEAMKDPWE